MVERYILIITLYILLLAASALYLKQKKDRFSIDEDKLSDHDDKSTETEFYDFDQEKVYDNDIDSSSYTN